MICGAAGLRAARGGADAELEAVVEVDAAATVVAAAARVMDEAVGAVTPERVARRAGAGAALASLMRDTGRKLFFSTGSRRRVASVDFGRRSAADTGRDFGFVSVDAESAGVVDRKVREPTRDDGREGFELFDPVEIFIRSTVGGSSNTSFIS